MLRGFFTADTGAPAGGSPPPAPEPTAPAQPPAQPPATSAATFSQEQLNAALAEERRKWKRQQDEEAARLKQAAEEQAAQARGEFEQLATTRATRITELEQQQTSLQEQLTALQEAMEKQIQARIRTLPEELRDMIPKDAPVLQRYDLIGKAEAAASKLSLARPGGTPPGPRGDGSTAGTHTTAPDLIEKKRRSGEYIL